MRILGEVPHSKYKITILEMSSKISIQIEDGLLTQTFRFRDASGISGAYDATLFCDEVFMEKVAQTFELMAGNQSNRLQVFTTKDQLDFPEII